MSCRSVFRRSHLGIAALAPTRWTGNFRVYKPLAIWNGVNCDIRRDAPSLRSRIAMRHITSTNGNGLQEPNETPPEHSETRPTGNPICDICRTNPTTEVITAATLRNRRLWDSSWTSFCQKCYRNYVAGRTQRRRAVAQEKASRKKRVAEMLERVRTTKIVERVDLLYANQRLKEAAKATEFFRKPAKRFQKNILDHLKEELDIQRVGRGYTCGKERVDAMDWKLWCLHPYLDIEV